MIDKNYKNYKSPFVNSGLAIARTTGFIIVYAVTMTGHEYKLMLQQIRLKIAKDTFPESN